MQQQNEVGGERRDEMNERDHYEAKERVRHKKRLAPDGKPRVKIRCVRPEQPRKQHPRGQHADDRRDA